MLKFVTLGDSSVARLTDQRVSTSQNATVSACSSTYTHPMVSWMPLATGNGRVDDARFLDTSGSKLTENETPLLRYSIYFHGRTTYIVITAKPQHETSIRIRESGSTTLYITDIKDT